MMIIDGHDEAKIGSACIWRDGHRVDVAVYDGDILVKTLMADGMSDEQALEYIEFNIEGAYMGIKTPVIMWRDE